MNTHPRGIIVEHQSELIRQRYKEAAPLHCIVAKGPHTELSFLYGKERDKDPEYRLLTETGIEARFSVTGIVREVEKDGKKILGRNNSYGNFSADGDTTEILTYVNELVRNLTFRDVREKDIIIPWDAQRVIARFSDINKLIGTSDPIPEFNDTMNIVKISDLCSRTCTYCPEPNSKGIFLYTMKRIDQNIDEAISFNEKYHNGHENRRNEGFLNSSDLLSFYLAKQYRQENLQPALEKMVKRSYLVDSAGNTTHIDKVSADRIPDPTEIADRFIEMFPNVSKLYAFMGVPTTNATPQEYIDQLFMKKRRWKSDHTKPRINRALVGIESCDDKTSKFLGKNERADEKRNALEKLLSAGFKVKAIVQVGAVGKGFFYHDNGSLVFRTSKEGLEVTAKELAKVAKGNEQFKILISRYTPIEGTPLAKMHDEGRIVPYSGNGLEEDIEYFTEELMKRKVTPYQIEDHYEDALEGRKTA